MELDQILGIYRCKHYSDGLKGPLCTSGRSHPAGNPVLVESRCWEYNQKQRAIIPGWTHQKCEYWDG